MKNSPSYTIFLLSISFMFLIGCNSKENDLKRSNLHGEIKTIKKIEYDVVEKFGKITKGKATLRIWKK